MRTLSLCGIQICMVLVRRTASPAVQTVSALQVCVAYLLCRFALQVCIASLHCIFALQVCIAHISPINAYYTQNRRLLPLRRINKEVVTMYRRRRPCRSCSFGTNSFNVASFQAPAACEAASFCECIENELSEPARAQNTVTSDCNLVAAGTAGASGCGCQAEKPDMLAAITFPIQTYCSGFCPQAALEQGTMFPELVRLYK